MAVVWLKRRLAQGRVSISAAPPETQAAMAWRHGRHRAVPVAGQTGDVDPRRNLAPVGHQRTVRGPPLGHRHGAHVFDVDPHGCRFGAERTAVDSHARTTLLAGTLLLQVRFGGRGVRSNEPFCYRSTVSPTPVTEPAASACALPGCGVTVVQPAGGGRRRLYCSNAHRAEARRRRIADSPDSAPGEVLGPALERLGGVLNELRGYEASLRSADPGRQAVETAKVRAAATADVLAAQQSAAQAAEEAADSTERLKAERVQWEDERSRYEVQLEELRTALSAARERAASSPGRSRSRPDRASGRPSTNVTSRPPMPRPPTRRRRPPAGRARPGSHRGRNRPSPGRGIRPPSLRRRGCEPSGGRPCLGDGGVDEPASSGCRQGPGGDRGGDPTGGGCGAAARLDPGGAAGRAEPTRPQALRASRTAGPARRPDATPAIGGEGSHEEEAGDGLLNGARKHPIARTVTPWPTPCGRPRPSQGPQRSRISSSRSLRQTIKVGLRDAHRYVRAVSVDPEAPAPREVAASPPHASAARACHS